MARSLERRTLFVYGSLRHGFSLHHHLVRLNARFLGTAKVCAQLFDLGSYPGARKSCREGNWVQGEVFQLGEPTRDLRVLDRVEGFIPAAPERSRYVREIAEIVMNNGKRAQAWVYWLGERVAPARRIASGDYSGGRVTQGESPL